jgi:N-acetylmuramoyl-L-alanine amidase
VQEFNPYIGGGTEEQYMNLVADAIEPYLEASGIEFGRNEPNESLGEAINKSNAGEYDLHVAIHSNASAADRAGTQQGSQMYYSPNSFYGTEFANILESNFKNIYPYPDKVVTVPTTTLREIRRTNAPATLIEVAYHDNYEDEAWIKNNINLIGETIARSIAEYFGVPFVAPLASKANEDGFVIYNLII